MTPMRVLVSRLVALFARRRREAELTDEIQAHLDALTEDHVRRGLSLANARAAARRDFGGIDQVKEAYRDQRTMPLVEVIGRDLRHALWNLRRSPLFTTVAVVTFALGVGATAAVFAIINSVLLRPLPYPNAARLVQIAQTLPNTRGSSAPPVIVPNLSPEQFRVLRTQSRTLSHVVAYSTTSMTLTGIENPTRVNVGLVAAGFFEAFGVPVLLGRPFAVADEPSVGPGPVAMLSHGAWMRWFGGDSAAAGKVVTLNDRRYPIVGIMPDGFNVPQVGAATITRNDAGQLEDTLDFWLPWTALASTGGGGSMFPALASMAEGVTVDHAAAEVRALLPPLPDGRRPTRVDVGSMRDQMVRAVRPTLMVFQVAVGFVLLIACANVANLLLARASHRRRDLAIRLALGASRFQVARESLAECVLLALGGSLLGSIIAAAAVRVVHVFPPGIMPRMAEIRIDATTLGFALALSMTAATVVAVFVSARILRAEAWRGVRDAALDFSRSRPSPMLVVLQVAAALVLFVGAGLLLRSFVGLANRNLGFEADNVLTFRLTLPKARYVDARQQAAFYARLIESLATNPDVEAAAAGTELPFQPTRLDFHPILIAGRPGEASAIATSLVTPGYLRVFRVPIVRGREFDASDAPGAPLSAIVGQVMTSRIAGMFSKRRREGELRDEIAAHLDALTDDYVRRGMSVAEARAAARREFGGVTQMHEAYRDQRGWPCFDVLAQDVRYAFRTLGKSRGFTGVAILILALGIGANTAIFSVLNAVVLRTFPVADPSELYSVRQEARTTTPGRFSYANFVQLRDAVAGAGGQVAGMSRVARMQALVQDSRSRETVNVQLVSGEYFSVLGVSPAMGRALSSADNERVGGHPVAVVSDGFWRRRLGGAADVVGREVTLNAAQFAIIGVGPPGFSGVTLESPVDLWIPLVMQGDVHYAQNYSADRSDTDKPWVPQPRIWWIDLIVRARSTPDTVAAALNAGFQPTLTAAAGTIGDPERRRRFLEQRLVLGSFAHGFSALRLRFATPLYVAVRVDPIVALRHEYGKPKGLHYT